jgi:hypothetical protein
MKPPKFTPGPWNANPERRVFDETVGFEIDSPNASVFNNPIGSFEFLENARLAAAAPDLYAVAEMAALTSYPRGHRAKMIIAARAALRKARGERPE